MKYFNSGAIGKVCFIGFRNEEELMFSETVLDALGELEVRDGMIVEKKVDDE